MEQAPLAVIEICPICIHLCQIIMLLHYCSKFITFQFFTELIFDYKIFILTELFYRIIININSYCAASCGHGV